MDEPMTHYMLSMNQEGADLLAWLSVETGHHRIGVLIKALALLKIALETENRGMELRSFDPATGESAPVTGFRKKTT